MKSYSLSDMTKGWFVGDFMPSVHQTAQFEVGVKRYKAGDHEEVHHHKRAQEITVVVSGKISMCGQTFEENAIVSLEQGEATGFTALTDAVTVVVKFPSVRADKFAGSA